MSTFDILFFSTTSITILGKEFRPGAIVCVNSPSSLEYPIFAEILRVFVPADTKQILIRLYNTKRYSNHFNAYHIVKGNHFPVICISELGIHEVYHKYSVSRNSYVVIKSYHHVEYDI